MCRINVQLLATVRFAFTIYLSLSVVAATSYFLPTQGGVFFVDKLLNLDALLLVLSGLSSLEKLMCIIRESKKCTL